MVQVKILIQHDETSLKLRTIEFKDVTYTLSADVQDAVLHIELFKLSPIKNVAKQLTKKGPFSKT